MIKEALSRLQQNLLFKLYTPNAEREMEAIRLGLVKPVLLWHVIDTYCVAI